MARADRPDRVLSSINFGEIYYNCWKEWGQVRADQIRVGFKDLPIRIILLTSNDVLQAARIKAQYPISYADAFAVGLAQRLKGLVLTGDSDFLKLRDAGTVSIEWWGA